MSCKTWISTSRGTIALHALEDHEVYKRLKQAEEERAVITRRIRADVIEQRAAQIGPDDTDDSSLRREAAIYRTIAADPAAATLAQVIQALFQEASRRRPLQRQLKIVRHILTAGDE